MGFKLCLLLAITSFASFAFADDLPDAPAKKLVITVCSGCHDLGTAIGDKRSAAGWKDTVDKMADRGARATDEEFAAITEYLTKYFGLPAKVEKTSK